MQDTTAEQMTLTVDQAAKLLRLARGSVYAAIARGEIPGSVRIGGRILIRRAVFERWMNGEPEPKPQAA